MSWSLYCHTEFPRDVNATGLPAVGSTTTGAVMWLNQNPTVNHDGNFLMGYAGNPPGAVYGLPHQNLFATGTNGKVMAIRHFGSTIDYSPDQGVSGWTQRILPGEALDNYGLGLFLRDIEYRESDDTWFILWMYDVIQQSAQQRRGYCYYSQDDGVTWTRTDSSIFHRDFHKLQVMQNGDVMGHAYQYGGGNGNYVIALTNSPASDAMSVFALGPSVSFYPRYSHEVAGGYLIMDAPTHGMIAAHPGAAGFDVLGASTAQSHLGSGANPNGVALFVATQVTNVITYKRITAASTEPYESGTITLVNSPNGWHFGYGGGKYIFTSGVASDLNMMEVWTSLTGVDGTWVGPYYWDLTVDKEPTADDYSGQSYYENWYHLRYMGNGNWGVGFRNNVTNKMNIVKVHFGEVATLPANYGPVRSAVAAQKPDIFLMMDDLGSPATVLDVGRQQYVNSVVGTPTFGEAGLVADGGTAVLIDAAADEGVLVNAVPAPVDHAHVFILQHDNTAAVRILASSGNIADTAALSYYIFLAADHKVGVATYDGGWVYNYSSVAIAAATPRLMAVRIKPDGTVTIYIQAAQDSEVSDVAVKALAATKLSIGGAWDGATMDNSADGVTIDYYALIPNAYFDYSKLVTAWGLTYSPPAHVDSAIPANVLLLVHANDTSMAGPLGNPTPNYSIVNSGTDGGMFAENNNMLTQADSVFGAGCINSPNRLVGEPWTPWDTMHWKTPIIVTPGLGVRDFTFDLRVKCLTTHPTTLWANHWVTWGTSNYYKYGGMDVVLTPKATTADITIIVYWPKGYPGPNGTSGEFLRMTFRDIPGYVAGGWNHVAVCRQSITERGLSLGGPPSESRTTTSSLWHAFINGKQVSPSVTGNASVSIRPGASHVQFGGHVEIADKKWYFLQRAARFDEIRFVIDQALFTEEFTPPAGPYSYV